MKKIKFEKWIQAFITVFILVQLISCGGSGSKKSDEQKDQSWSGHVDQVEVPEAQDENISRSEVVPPPKRETPADAYAPLSEAYRSQNDEAISRAAVHILSQNPSDEKALNSMGLYHYRKGRFLAAKYFFGRLLTVNPNSSAAIANMGLADLALGEQSEAIRQFKKSLEINPREGVAAANLGSIYVQEKDYTKAQMALEIAVKNGMRETRTLTNYAISLTGTGQYESAKSTFDEALRLNANNKEALFGKAILLIDQMKQYSEGLETLERLKFLGPVAEMRNRMNTLENTAKTGIK